MLDWFPSSRALVTIGGFSIYWYGVLYVVSFIGAYFFVDRLQRYRGLSLTKNQLLELITWCAVGVVIGGRLGYMLLYEPLFYLAHPLEIIQLSQGGMSSHGGFVGVAVAIWLAREGKGGFWLYLSLLDAIAIPAAFGVALGRLGNLINHELYVTPLAQAMAVGSPLVLAGVCWWYLRRWDTPGHITGLFLILYSLARFIEEWLREPQWPLVSDWLTWGQLYTIPLLLLGLWLLRGTFFVVWSKDEADSQRRARAD